MESGSTSPRVGVVVLNWHDRPRTDACLASLGSLDYGNHFVVLVDNESSDFRDAAFPPHPEVIYLHSDTNLGYAGGCNLGMRRALLEGADFVWFLNNDALPEPESLRTLVADALESKAAIVGPKILRYRSDPPRIDSLAVAVDLDSGRFGLVGHDEVDVGQYDRLREVDAVTGCAMLIRADSAEALGGFDERYFLYLEDIDLCLRAHAAGGVIRCVTAARVQHDRPAARRGRQSAESLYYTCRNHFLLMARHGHGNAAQRALRAGVILALNLAYAILDRADRATSPTARVAAVLAGARDYARGRFGMRVRRSSA